MILRRGADGLRVVLQTDHQVQCRAIAGAWGNERFARPDPYGPLLAAARWHDEGWRTWEAAPRVRDDGAPVNFTEIDPLEHTALYRHGIARAAAEGPLAGLLVSLHGQGLYERRLGLDGPPRSRLERPPVVRAFIADQEALQRGLRDRARDGAGLEAWAWAGYRLLQAWDVLSLYLTWRGLASGSPNELPRVPRSAGDDAGVTMRLAPVDAHTCSCDPWPFAAGRVDLPLPTRVIPDRPYAGAADLERELARAPLRVAAMAVVPA